MALEESYATIEEIPEAFRELYTERNGAHVCTGINGMLGSSERVRLQNENGARRITNTELTTSLGGWSNLGETPDAVRTLLDSIPVLQAQADAAGGDAEAIQKQVDARVRVTEVQHQRAIETLNTAQTNQAAVLLSYEDGARSTAIRNAVIKAAQDSKQGKINPDALEDVVMYGAAQLQCVEERGENGQLMITGVVSKENVGVTPGMDAGVWLTEMSPKKGHWYMESSGGSGGPRKRDGSGMGGNPWMKANWSMAAQGRFVREHGADKARAAAEQAGSKLGAVAPAE